MARFTALIRGALAGGALCAAASGSAQEVPDSLFTAQTALRRPSAADPLDPEPRPELQALGVRLGSYTLNVSTDLAPLISSNPRGRPNGDLAGAAYAATKVQLSSTGERDPLVLYLASTLTAYADPSTETVGTVAAGIDWTKEINSALSVRLSAEGGSYAEDRALSFTPDLSRRPIQFDRIVGTIEATASTGRVTVTPSLHVDRLAYHDAELAAAPGVVLVERTRSLTRIEPSLTLGYAVSTATQLYAGVDYNTRRYDIAQGLNSDGYGVFAGARLRPTQLTRLDIALGYQRQDYRPGFTDPSGLYARVSGLYSPDRATTITVDYRRDISETGGVEVGGLTRDRVSASVRRDVLRDFRITGSAELRRYDFASIDRSDRRWFIGADARYVLNRNLELFARGEQAISRSGGTASTSFDFDRTTVLSGVTLKL